MKLRDNRYRFNKSTRKLRLVKRKLEGKIRIIKTRESVVYMYIARKNDWHCVKIETKFEYG